MSVKVAVVIPVYNVDRYLKQCVNSVLSQTYNDYEIILVDDGSMDSSPVICDEYAIKDNRIKVIHQENGGLSSARNTGIVSSTGDYILFLDSDDYWDDPECLEKLVDRIKCTKADVLNFSYIKLFEGNGVKVCQFSDVPEMSTSLSTKRDQLEYLCGNFLYIASACNKMIKRTVFTKDMMFEKGRLSEDVEWCARLLKNADSFDFVCENFYCYRQREGSITHTFAEKSCIDLSKNIVGCVNIAKDAPEEIRNYIYMYTAYQLSTFFAVQAFVKNCPDECMEILAGLKWLLKYHGNNKKVTCLYLGCKVLGFRGLCKAVRIAKPLWSR